VMKTLGIFSNDFNIGETYICISSFWDIVCFLTISSI